MSCSVVAVTGVFGSNASKVARQLKSHGVVFETYCEEATLESRDLDKSLKRWLAEEIKGNPVPASVQVAFFQNWLDAQSEEHDWIGIQHPLLGMFLDSLEMAIGPRLDIIWCESSGDLLHKPTPLRFVGDYPLQTQIHERCKHAVGMGEAIKVAADNDVSQSVEAWAKKSQVAKPERNLTSRTATEQDSIHGDATVVGHGNRILGVVVRTSESQDQAVNKTVASLSWCNEVIVLSACNLKTFAHSKVGVISLQHESVDQGVGAGFSYAVELARQRDASYALTLVPGQEVSGSADKSQLEHGTIGDHVCFWVIPASDGGRDCYVIDTKGQSFSWNGRYFPIPKSIPGEVKVVPGVFVRSGEAITDQGTLSRWRDDLRDLTSMDDSVFSYELGLVQFELGEYEGAAFSMADYIHQGGSESSWASYIKAQALTKMRRYQQAIDCCASGLAFGPAVPELYWLASCSAYELGQDSEALTWAQLACSIGLIDGIGELTNQQRPRELTAWFEGPYECMARSFDRLGFEKSSIDAKESANAARKLRYEFLNGSTGLIF